MFIEGLSNLVRELPRLLLLLSTRRLLLVFCRRLPVDGVEREKGPDPVLHPAPVLDVVYAAGAVPKREVVYRPRSMCEPLDAVVAVLLIIAASGHGVALFVDDCRLLPDTRIAGPLTVTVSAEFLASLALGEGAHVAHADAAEVVQGE